MADPFSVQPPAWLQSIAKPVNSEELGLTLAKGLSTIATSLQADPNAAPDSSWLASRKGLTEGAAEVNMAQIDPQWQLHGQELANRVQMQRVQMSEQGAFLEQQRRENSAWLNELPDVSTYISTPPEQLEGKAVPRVTSQKGLQAVQAKQAQAEQYKLRKAQQDNILETRRVQQEQRDWQLYHGAAWQKRNQQVQEGYLNLPASDRAVIDAIPNGRSKNGVFSSAAESAIEDALKRNNMPGIGQAKPGAMSPETKVQLDDLRADEADLRRRITAAEKAGSPTEDLESELADVKEQRKALAGGGAQPTAGQGATSRNPIQRQLDSNQDKIETLQSKVNPTKDEKKQLDAAKTERSELFRKQALHRNRELDLKVDPVIKSDDKSQDIEKRIGSMPDGATILWENGKGDPTYITLNPKTRSELLKRISGDSSTASPGSQPLHPGVYHGEEERQARATFLRNKLDKQGADKMTEAEARELNQLEEEVKKPEASMPDTLEFNPNVGVGKIRSGWQSTYP